MGNHPHIFMRNDLKIFVSIILSIQFTISCSSSEETQVKEIQKTTDTVYTFDEIPPEDLFEFESPAKQSTDIFVVQIGAFSNVSRAKEFADESRTILNKDIKVEYDQHKTLYVVWIYPPFNNKQSAIEYRTKIQNDGKFNDAWIVTIDAKK